MVISAPILVRTISLVIATAMDRQICWLTRTKDLTVQEHRIPTVLTKIIILRKSILSLVDKSKLVAVNQWKQSFK